jgi:hypothetical protein
MDYLQDIGFFRLMYWLHGIWFCHYRANLLEKKHHQPGIRTVLVAGSRIAFSLGDKSTSQLILARRPNLDPEDLPWMYKKEFLSRTAFYMPWEFQMNLAFAKAYSLEALGSRGGLSGPRFFVDNTIVAFLLTTLNGTKFSFHTPNAPEKMAVHVERVSNPSYEVIKILAPDPDGIYKEIGFVAFDPQPIESGHGSVWVVRRIEFPFSSEADRELHPNDSDSQLYGPLPDA